MAIFSQPKGLELVAHFLVSRVQTWGSSRDQEFKTLVREAAGLSSIADGKYDGFVFSIHAVLARSRGSKVKQVPDVENIPKLIVDAFSGILYPDDNLHYVRAVQVEAEFSRDEQEKTEVWIYGTPREKHAER